MCECGCKCQHPEKLKDKPDECSEEQIDECHGSDNGHPCSSKENE